MKQYPRITIVTPSYNQGLYLEECIESILSQSYPNLEYIIMDGGSTDNSVEIIKKYEKYLSYWQSMPDDGQYKAINDGFARSTGEIMTWLNSDDKMHPNSLLKVASVFNIYPQVQWIIGRPSFWDKEGNLTGIAEDFPKWNRDRILGEKFDDPFIQQESTYWRRSIWNKAGGSLKTDLDYAGDLELWVRFFRIDHLYRIETLLGGWRSHGDQKTSLQINKYYEEARIIIEQECSNSFTPAYSSVLPQIILPDIINLSSDSAFKNLQSINQVDCWKSYVQSLSNIVSYSKAFYKYEVINVIKNDFPELRIETHASSSSIKNKKFPRISIITPSFNQGEFLEETIQSVLNQNYPNLEYIIIDGGSTDNSVDIIKKYEKHLTYWVSEKDSGQANAINKGFKKTTGDIVVWLNSDDFYYPGTLHRIAEMYLQNSDAGMYTGNGFLTDKTGKQIRKYAKTVGFDIEALQKGSCFILQPSTFINRKVFEKIGYLNESLRYGLDLDYWLRIAKHFQVITIDEPLSAYRWYDEVKTNEGFKRWIELWSIYKEHTNLELTPGLLVEFFSILKKDEVLKDVGMDIGEFAEKGFRYTYALMQQALNLDDCIPKEKSILHKPTNLKEESTVHIVNKTEPNPQIDVVLQATGEHAWSVGEGWINAAKKLGIFNKVFKPRAVWGEEDLLNDDGLFNYLDNPQSDIILLPGFDWHSQALHSSLKWRERWQNVKAKKILIVQESVENNCRLFNSGEMKQALNSAASLVDGIIFTDITDEAFFKELNKPNIWQPFGVDETVFNNKNEFKKRIPKAFFRGKYTPFFTNSTYEERRLLLKFLIENNLVDLIEYKNGHLSVEEIAADFNRYQIAVNLPSIFSNHPTRVYEALACGCALITNRTCLPLIDEIFEDRKHLLYYSTREELKSAIEELKQNKDLAEQIALNGNKYVLENYTLTSQLEKLIKWTVDGAAKKEKKEAFQISSTPKILIDGVIFQLQQNRPAGIHRVWKSLLTELGKTELAEFILLLDRDNTSPSFDGIKKRTIKSFGANFENDSEYLKKICIEENAGLFISTYFTSAAGAKNIVMLHDFIPEIAGWDLSNYEWQCKQKAINNANAFLSVSASTMNDFRKFYPHLSDKEVFIIPNAASDEFKIRSITEVNSLKKKYNISKPYFIVSGHRQHYKNVVLFLKAINLIPDKKNYEILFTGGNPDLEEEFRSLLKGIKYQIVFLIDSELSTAYSGAIALVYPSKYEGFGLPVLEAMKCGCPVITCRNSSIPEVAGDAVIYVDENDVQSMKKALDDVKKTKFRKVLIEKGIDRSKIFQWKKSACKFINAVREISNNVRNNPGAIKTINQKKVKVSAIVSTYNSERFIKDCIEDLLNQTLYKRGELEIVIVNSNSQQNEDEIVKKYLNDGENIIYIKTEERETIYKAWNRGIAAASGEYITNANTDDRHAPEALEKLSGILDEKKDVDIVYADDYTTKLENDKYDSPEPKATQRWIDFEKDLLLFGCFIGPHPVWRKTLHDRFGLFDDKLKVVGDYEFWLRISREAKFYHLNEILGLYLSSETSVEHTNSSLTKSENDLVQIKYIVKYVKDINDFERIKTKLELVLQHTKNFEYHNSALSVLFKRKKGLALESELNEFIKNVNSYTSEARLSLISFFTEELNKTEIFANTEFYKPILENLKCGKFESSLISTSDMILIEDAETLIMQNRLPEAKEVLNNILEQHPLSVDALNDLSVIKIMQKDYDGGLKIIEKIIQLDPENEIAIENLNYVESLLSKR